jgi:predicted MFS family arabinose efflux permease
MSLAVNASTIGMAVAGLIVALFSRRIDRRQGILVSLLLLAIPTYLLSTMPELPVFALLRVAQGIFMASAFTLTLAYLAERCSAREAVSAAAAYVTGNVASNLFGRLLSAAVADHLGLSTNFTLFALLNVAGALLVFFGLQRTPPMSGAATTMSSPLAAWGVHLRNPALRAVFGIGFLILFAFIGTFTYVNFLLIRAPYDLAPMSLGLVYLVFLPSIITTPVAGRIAARFGNRPAFFGALALSAVGLPLLLLPQLVGVLAGLVLVGVGTFFAQACATGFVGQAASGDRGAASGLYLASYFMGGLVGSAVLGQLYDSLGWPTCVAGIATALALAALLATQLTTRPQSHELSP